MMLVNSPVRIYNVFMNAGFSLTAGVQNRSAVDTYDSVMGF